MNFKVGDVVKFIRKYHFSLGDGDPEEGDVGIILNINYIDDRYYNVRFFNGKNNLVIYNRLELVNG